MAPGSDLQKYLDVLSGISKMLEPPYAQIRAALLP